MKQNDFHNLLHLFCLTEIQPQLISSS